MSLRSMFGFSDKSEQVRLYNEERPASEYDGVLIQYIRPYHEVGDNTPIGCVVALKDHNGIVQYGWALCRPDEAYDKEYGRSEAIAKALVAGDSRVKRDTKPALRRAYVKAKNKVKKVDVVELAIARLQHRAAKYFV